MPFDQLNRQAAQKCVAALQSFIHDYFPNIRLVIAGRPYAIKRVWDELELGATVLLPKEDSDDVYEKPVWEFCKVEKFSGDKAKEYLSAEGGSAGGDKKLAALKRMNASEIRLPRTLNIVRQLKPAELEQMHTASDLYYEPKTQRSVTNPQKSRPRFHVLLPFARLGEFPTYLPSVVSPAVGLPLTSRSGDHLQGSPTRLIRTLLLKTGFLSEHLSEHCVSEANLPAVE